MTARFWPGLICRHRGHRGQTMLLRILTPAIGIGLRQDGTCAASNTHWISAHRIAARLREETTLAIGQIARRLKMRTRDTLSAKLQERKGANDRAKKRKSMDLTPCTLARWKRVPAIQPRAWQPRRPASRDLAAWQLLILFLALYCLVQENSAGSWDDPSEKKT